MHPTLKTLLASLALLAASAAQAADPTVHNDDIPQGTASFDAVVGATGAQLQLQPLQFLQDGGRQFDFADFTITATDGGQRLVDDDYGLLRERGHVGALTGWALGLVPNAPVAGSGLTFVFHQPINAFGIEIGDWATCCYRSSLFIAFDGGATRLVATARIAADNPGMAAYGQPTNFIGAIDTSGSFTQVTLYGDGIGEYLVAGGTIRYASLPLGSVALGSVAASVPEPPARALWLAGLVAAGFLLRRRHAGRQPRWNGVSRRG